LDVKGKRPEVLVVEDDHTLASMYRTALRLAGYEVDVTSNGVTALWHLDQSRPDLVVLDLHLPGIRGEAILSEIAARSDLSHIPVVVVTGSDAQDVVAQANAILRKPVDVSRLVSVVEQHLDPAA
jgi:two-component system, sensor histidine kinase and response regulator